MHLKYHGRRYWRRWLVMVFILTFLSGAAYALSSGTLGVDVSIYVQPNLVEHPIFHPPITTTPPALYIPLILTN